MKGKGAHAGGGKSTGLTGLYSPQGRQECLPYLNACHYLWQECLPCLNACRYLSLKSPIGHR